MPDEKTGDGATAQTGREHGQQPPPTSESVPAGYVAEGDSAAPGAGPSTPRSSEGWAQPGTAVHQSESAALALHLDAQPELSPPIAPEPGEPDPEAARAGLEAELGVSELETSLAGYGTPPIAPPPRPADRWALESELLGTAAKEISRWNVWVRRSLRTRVRQQAARQARAEDDRLAAEQRQLQAELNDRWAELRALRHRAAHQASEWAQQEIAQSEAERAKRQAILDSEWQQMKDADSDSVIARLASALPDEATTTVGFRDGVAVLVVTYPDRDEVISDTEPAFTDDRHRAVRARSQTRRNDLYLSAIASRVLAAVGRALSATPAVEAVTCLAVRGSEARTSRWEPIYVGTFERTYIERLIAEGRWSSDPEVLAEAVNGADEVHLELDGSTHEVGALDLSPDPGLAGLVEQLDAGIRSDDNAPGRSGEEAAETFLGFDDTGQQEEIEMGEEQFAHQGDGNPAAQPETAAPEPDQMPAAEQPETAAPEPEPLAVAEPPEMASSEMRETVMPEGSRASGREPPLGGQPASGKSHREGALDVSLPFSHGDGASAATGDPLPFALKDSDGSVRRAAVEAIGRRNDPSDTPLLLQALRDQDDIVRLEAMYALKDRLSPDLRRDALIRASGDSDDVVRRKAIEALADLADDRDTPLLTGALKDPNARVRLEALYAVRYRLAPDMRDALIDACSDDDEGVRRKAIEALAELGDERDAPLLLKALKDSDSTVRLEAIYALERRSVLAPSSQLSEPLLEAMTADDAIVRQAAVRLFGRLEGPGTSTPPA